MAADAERRGGDVVQAGGDRRALGEPGAGGGGLAVTAPTISAEPAIGGSAAESSSRPKSRSASGE